MDDLEDLCYRLPSLVLRQSVQPLNHRLHFLLADELPNEYFFIHNQEINSLTDYGLTKLSLPCLFGRRRERGEQLHENLDNHLIHGFCGRDLGIDLEAIEEVTNRLEQTGQGTVVIYDALDRLIRLNITKIHTHRLSIGTYREQNTEASLYCFHGRETL
jgi:hypothetical protein